MKPFYLHFANNCAVNIQNKGETAMLKEIYSYNDSVTYLNDWISSHPKGGRGMARKISEHLNISTVLTSQILNGKRTLKLDHAYNLALFTGLAKEETEFFLLLVQHDNAGTAALKNFFRSKIKAIQNEHDRLHTKLNDNKPLPEQIKAQFYSHWLYSAVRLCTDIPELQTPAAIAKKLHTEERLVRDILKFLIENELCEVKANRLHMKTKETHLEDGSPWIYSRQIQWRHKAIANMSLNKSNETLFYTGPMVLSRQDAKWVRDQLIQLVRKIVRKVGPSPSENLMCLNIDWFSFANDHKSEAIGPVIS
jgi:uncharacterized protein (TIGR02147 family)